jgi:putative ABC transport system ATP-binding protein
MKPVVQLQDIHKIYDSGEVQVHAVRGVSLEIHRGEFLAIMGASGSGKSTLMNMLGCLDRPTRGQYLLDGINVSGLARNELADIRNEKLGFVFQGFNLLSRTTALENVELPMLYGRRRFPAREMKERALHCLEIVGLSNRADHFPSQLSGGQQQRVAIARGLVNEPQILLADEPTGNLDPDLSLEIMNLLREINAGGTTVLVATHDRELIRLVGRRTITLDAGRLVEVA